MTLFSNPTDNLNMKILLHASGHAAAVSVSEIIKSELPHVELVNIDSVDKVSAQLQEAVVLFIVISDYDSLDSKLDSITKHAEMLDVLTFILCIEPVDHRDRYFEKFIKAIEHYSGICGSLFLIPDLSNTSIVQEDLLRTAVNTFVELFAKVGVLKMDFDDYNFIFRNKGIGLFGLGTGNNTELALEKAMESIGSSYIKELSLQYADNVLLNIKAGHDYSSDELERITHKLQPLLNEDAFVYYRLLFDDDMAHKIEAALFATGSKNSKKDG